MSYGWIIPIVVVAYLLGAFPTGILVARYTKGVDLRQIGSGRTGATNALRALGWQLSLVVFIGDALKGGLAVLLPRLVFGLNDPLTPYFVMVCGLACLCGHIFSIFINFKGGRGVAAGVGQVAVITPIGALVCLLVALPTIARTGYVSLGSVLGAALMPIVIVVQAVFLRNTAFGIDPAYIPWSVICGGIVVIAHRDNIQRLLNGTERKLGEKPKSVTEQPQTNG